MMFGLPNKFPQKRNAGQIMNFCNTMDIVQSKPPLNSINRREAHLRYTLSGKYIAPNKMLCVTGLCSLQK